MSLDARNSSNAFPEVRLLEDLLQHQRSPASKVVRQSAFPASAGRCVYTIQVFYKKVSSIVQKKYIFIVMQKDRSHIGCLLLPRRLTGGSLSFSNERCDKCTAEGDDNGGECRFVICSKGDSNDERDKGAEDQRTDDTDSMNDSTHESCTFTEHWIINWVVTLPT